MQDYFQALINHTSSQPLYENMILGGCFFFNKNENDQKTTKNLFTTLCSGLMEYFPGVKSGVRDYIYAHLNIGNESIK